MNTIIDNLLNFNKTENNENNNENNKTTNVERVVPHVSIEKTIPSLQQGRKFNQYQDKITKNIEANFVNNLNSKDKLANRIENFTNNENDKNDERLKQEYNQILSEYKDT